jgi:hypothetical protein
MYIYLHLSPSLIYTPLPNSKRLHNTALRYAGSVQIGAFMWLDGLNWVKMGAKMGANIPFEYLKWSRIIFGKTHF